MCEEEMAKSPGKICRNHHKRFPHDVTWNLECQEEKDGLKLDSQFQGEAMAEKILGIIVVRVRELTLQSQE